MRLREFFKDVSSEPNDTTNKPKQSTERSMEGQPKKESNWAPLESCYPGFDRYALAIRECVNTRFISCTHNVVPYVIQSTLRSLILCTSHVGDFYCLPKIHKANTPGRPIISGIGTLCENLSGYVEGILKPI
eukprot:g27961.t1